MDILQWLRVDSLRGSRKIPRFQRREVWRRSKGRCEECGSGRRLRVHHVVPRAKAGTHNLENLKHLCATCEDEAHNRRLENRP